MWPYGISGPYGLVSRRGGGTTVVPDAASAVGDVTGPTVVLGSVSVSPGVTSVVGSVVDPIVVLGSLAIVPAAAAVVGSVVDPTVVVGSGSIVPDAATAAGYVVDPTVILGSVSVVPDPTVVLGTVINPNVVITGSDFLDTHDGWLEYRRRARVLAQLAEKRRRATLEEARQIWEEVLAALSDAAEMDDRLVEATASDVIEVLGEARPSVENIMSIRDWGELYYAVSELRAAMENARAAAREREMEDDDETVLLLI
jgi:carbonic anhydrase/acetyltransferase-like protein (isoleucine patch superfamily)